MKKTVIIAAAIALVSAFFAGCDNGTKTLAELKKEADNRLEGALDLSKAECGWTFDGTQIPTADLSYDILTGFLTIKNKTGWTQVVVPVEWTKEKTATVVVSSPVPYRLGLIPKGGKRWDGVYTDMDETNVKVFNKGAPCEQQKITLNIDEEEGVSYIAIGSATWPNDPSEIVLHTAGIK